MSGSNLKKDEAYKALTDEFSKLEIFTITHNPIFLNDQYVKTENKFLRNAKSQIDELVNDKQIADNEFIKITKGYTSRFKKLNEYIISPKALEEAAISHIMTGIDSQKLINIASKNAQKAASAISQGATMAGTTAVAIGQSVGSAIYNAPKALAGAAVANASAGAMWKMMSKGANTVSTSIANALPKMSVTVKPVETKVEPTPTMTNKTPN